MTKAEKEALKVATARIRSLASMENACFDISETKDKEIKDEVRPYMSWFDSVATFVDALVDAKDADEVQFAISQIHRYCN